MEELITECLKPNLSINKKSKNGILIINYFFINNIQ